MIDLRTFLDRVLVSEGDSITVKFVSEDDKYGEPYVIRRSTAESNNAVHEFPFVIARREHGVKGYGSPEPSRWYSSEGDIQIDKIYSGGILVPQGLTLLCRSVEDEVDEGED